MGEGHFDILVLIIIANVNLLRGSITGHKEGDLYREYLVDDSRGFGRRFDGVGAISGGGATSKLLVNYPEPQRSQILDYLFKPNFGASLQILKVEIGGDSQSTDGSESSHMHTENDENYNRGYEWWLMKEAKKRNPDIRLYGLPWTFPGWVGSRMFNPFQNRTKPIKYILNWIRGAKTHHNLDINYIGVWNERYCDALYIKMLRRELDNQGMHSVQIVAPDSMTWSMIKTVHNDKDLAAALDIMGVHYLSVSPADALTIDRPLWESEAYSARNDLRGGACWARVLNEGYVRGFITGYIAWNLIASYYDGLPYSRSSIMTGNEPWSGHYEVASPVWTTAHLTQFVDVGWKYLPMDRGVGELVGNGTFVAIASPDSKQLTIIIQNMDPHDVPCFYPMPKYTVSDNQTATFHLQGTFAKIKELNVWYSEFDIRHYVKVNRKNKAKCKSSTVKGWCDTSTADIFRSMPPIKVEDGKFTLNLKKNQVYTITTVSKGRKGSFDEPIPQSLPFPLPYSEDFERYNETQEPFNFAQQSGSFEVVQSNDLHHGKVMEQTTTDPPVDTCLPDRMPAASNLIGDSMWEDVSVQTDVYIESPPKGANGVFLGARIDIGGCWSMYANGIYFWLFPNSNNWTMTGNFTRSVIYSSQPFDVQYERWYTIRLDISGEKGVIKEGRNVTVKAFIDGAEVFNVLLDPSLVTSPHGFVGLGATNHGRARFDNFRIHHATRVREAKHKRWSNLFLEEQLSALNQARDRRNGLHRTSNKTRNQRLKTHSKSRLHLLFDLISKKHHKDGV